MRHNVFGNHLGRNTKGAKRLYRGLMASVLIYGKVQTTQAKAASIRGDLEKLISLGKTDGFGNRRQAIKMLGNDLLIDRLFKSVGPGFAEVASGYTRTLKIGKRVSDSADMVMLELTRLPIEMPTKVIKDETQETNSETKEKKQEPKDKKKMAEKSSVGRKKPMAKRKISKD